VRRGDPTERPLTNTAIVGLESQRPLCGIATAHLMVTAEHSSDAPSRAQLSVRQDGRQLAEPAPADLAPHERASVPIDLPETFQGWLDVVLEAPRDALAVDNHARILIRSSSTLPVVIASERPAFRRVIGEWLSACEGLAWTESPAGDAASPHLVVTDEEAVADHQAAGVLRMLNPAASQEVVFAHWVVAADHAISSYLPPVEPVVASLPLALETVPAGDPVLWGLIKGRRVPIVLAGEDAGHRMVSFFIDPVASPTSTPVLVTFFNSLRWLMGQTDMVRTGEPILLDALEPGPVTVRRPDGMVERVPHAGGLFRYDATTSAGRYQFLHGHGEEVRAVNFLDPLESNLLDRASTWRPMPPRQVSSGEERRSRVPLSNMLMMMLLGLLMAEWWLYTAKKR